MCGLCHFSGYITVPLGIKRADHAGNDPDDLHERPKSDAAALETQSLYLSRAAEIVYIL